MMFDRGPTLPIFIALLAVSFSDLSAALSFRMENMLQKMKDGEALTEEH